jgi:hypothetical protein
MSSVPGTRTGGVLETEYAACARQPAPGGIDPPHARRAAERARAVPDLQYAVGVARDGVLLGHHPQRTVLRVRSDADDPARAERRDPGVVHRREADPVEAEQALDGRHPDEAVGGERDVEGVIERHAVLGRPLVDDEAVGRRHRARGDHGGRERGGEQREPADEHERRAL